MKLGELKFKPGHYLAYVLSDKCRADLLKLYAPKHEKVFIHHVTIEFNLNEEKLQKIMASFKGKVKGMVTGACWNERVDCFTVSINGQTKRPSHGFYHVTASCAPGAKPGMSNDLLEKRNGEPEVRWRGFIFLEGEIQLVKK